MLKTTHQLSRLRAECRRRTHRVVDLLVRAPERVRAVHLLRHLALPALAPLPRRPKPLQPPEPPILVPQRLELAPCHPQQPERVARLAPLARVDPEPLVRQREGERAPVREVPPQGGREVACADGGRRGRLGGRARLVVEGVDLEVQLGEEGGGRVRGRQGRAGRRRRVGDLERAREEAADREQVGVGQAGPAWLV